MIAGATLRARVKVCVRGAGSVHPGRRAGCASLAPSIKRRARKPTGSAGVDIRETGSPYVWCVACGALPAEIMPDGWHCRRCGGRPAGRGDRPAKIMLLDGRPTVGKPAVDHAHVAPDARARAS